jgi:hypothetical protein
VSDTFKRARRLRELADDLERYDRHEDLRRALGVEVAVLGASIMAGEDADQIETITLKPGMSGRGYYVAEEEGHTHGQRGPLRRLAARLQRHQ